MSARCSRGRMITIGGTYRPSSPQVYYLAVRQMLIQVHLQLGKCSTKCTRSTLFAICSWADRTGVRGLHGLHIRNLLLYVHFSAIVFFGTNFALAVALTTIASIFEFTYHESTGIAGLNYIALGVGLTFCSQLSARYMDRIYRHLTETRGGGVGEPEFRLRESESCTCYDVYLTIL
jgi:hypothetical protein